MTHQPAPQVPQQRTPEHDTDEVVTKPPINLKRVQEAGNARYHHFPQNGRCPTCGTFGECARLRQANAILDEEGIPR